MLSKSDQPRLPGLIPDQRSVSPSPSSHQIAEFEKFRGECLRGDDPSLMTREGAERVFKFVPAHGCRVHIDESVIRAYLSDEDYSKAVCEASRPLADENGQVILPEWSEEFLDAFVLVNAGPAAVPRNANIETLEAVPFEEKISLGEIARGGKGNQEPRHIEIKPVRRQVKVISLSEIDAPFVDSSPRRPVKIKGLVVQASNGAFGFKLSDGRQSIFASMNERSAGLPVEGEIVDAAGHLVKTAGKNGSIRISLTVHKLSKSREEFKVPCKEVLRQARREYQWRPVLVDAQKAFDEMLERIRGNPVVSLDTETVGPALSTQRAEVIGLGDPLAGTGYIIDLQAVEKGEIDGKSLAAFLAAPKPRKILHYAKFDKGVLGDRGFKLGAHEDTYAMSQRLVPEICSFSLESLARWVTDLGMSKDREVQTGDWSARPLSAEQQDYLCHDLEATWAVYEYLRALEEKAGVSLDSETPELLLGKAERELAEKIEGRKVLGEVIGDRTALLFHIKELLLDGALPYDNRSEYGTVYVRDGASRSGSGRNLSLNLVESMERLQRVQREFLSCLFDDRDSPLPVLIARINLIVEKLNPAGVPSLYLRLNV